tara:strand:- start:1642 stop:2427 length:786 start_codon:yes stop_codon:yes gene_type:complete
MSETLTYDNTPDAEVLTADEQDSLAVGEQLEEQQNELLAGKYKSAEELEKAYVELQKKLGETDNEAEETEPEEPEESEEPAEQSAAAELISNASAEYAESGELTAETKQKFAEMSSQELVEAYIEMQANAPVEEAVQEAPEITESEINQIKNSIGGDQAYGRVMEWASQNLEQNQIDAYDNIVATGSADAIQMMIAGLNAQYEASNGYEGRMLSGKAAIQNSDVFRSQAELVSAMSDPRYENDAAYRNDLLEKLDRSDLNF